MFISGTSGHAAEDTQHKYPYMVDGHLLRLNFTKPIYQLNLQQSTGGTIAGSPLSGASGTQFNLSATSNNKYTFDGFSVTGAALTGSAGTYTNSDVIAKGNWTYHPEPVFVSAVTGHMRIWNDYGNTNTARAQVTYTPFGILTGGEYDDAFVEVTHVKVPGRGIGTYRIIYRENPMLSASGTRYGTSNTLYYFDVPSADPMYGFYGSGHTQLGPTFTMSGATGGVFSAISIGNNSATWSGNLYRYE